MMNVLRRAALACEIEPIHAPDAIQSWGAMLIADAVCRYSAGGKRRHVHTGDRKRVLKLLWRTRRKALRMAI